MLASNPMNIDSQPTDLEYWVRRATSKREAGGESHFTYKGVSLVVHPKRAAEMVYDGRSVVVEGTYRGRGWVGRFVGDIESGITTLLEGGGEEDGNCLGDRLRAEMERRENGDPLPEPEERHWYQWLHDDELPILLGAWMHRAGIMGMRYTISRKPMLGFYPTNDEFHHGVQACSPSNLFVTLQRLATARMQTAGVAP